MAGPGNCVTFDNTTSMDVDNVDKIGILKPAASEDAHKMAESHLRVYFGMMAKTMQS